MKDMELNKALTVDRHFEQAGFQMAFNIDDISSWTWNSKSQVFFAHSQKHQSYLETVDELNKSEEPVISN